MRQIEEVYVAAGKVRFVYHHMAFIGEESIRAAEASECANEQGRFWDYADTLFANQNGKNRGAFADVYLKSFAEGLALDTLKFNQCLDSRKYRNVVTQETQQGRGRGVQVAPTIFIDGQMAQFQAFEEIPALIDQALAAKGAGG